MPSRIHATDPSASQRLTNDDKWNVAETEFEIDQSVPWKDLSKLEKITHVIQGITKVLVLLLILFTFVSTFSLVSRAFNLIGGHGLGKTIRTSKVVQNPISAVILGMVVTLLLQSSSTLMSLLVGMVSGQILAVHQAIPIMMGAEAGSSILNALIALTQSGDRSQFRRAFAAATMNDIYNFLCVATLLPLELILSPIERLSALAVSPLKHIRTGKLKTLDALTDPILDTIVQVDLEGLSESQLSNSTDNITDTFVKRCINLKTKEELPFCPYEHIFAYSTWSDMTIGVVLLSGCILSLALCMYGIVKIMNGLLAGRIAVIVKNMMNKSLPFPFGWLTDYFLMAFAALVVAIMGSSSVFRSALTPLVGLGVVTLDRFFPLVIGGNIGTTSTGVLAAFSSNPSKLQITLQMAFCQTIFNLLSAVIFYPIPFMRKIPIDLSMKFGDVTAKYRWFAAVYIIVVFFLMPALLLGLSFLPPVFLFTFIGLVFGILIFVILITKLQKKCPGILPGFLRDWYFLPVWLRSLEPYDRCMISTLSGIPYIGVKFKNSVEDSDESRSDISSTGCLDSDNTVKRLIRLSKETQV